MMNSSPSPLQGIESRLAREILRRRGSRTSFQDPLAKEIEAYRRYALRAGCSEEQADRFIAAKIALQPKQLSASAAARECDRPDGPTRVGFGGARSGGKSFWALAQLACDDCQRRPGLKALYLRKVGKSGAEAIEDLRLQVLRHVEHEYKRHLGLLVFPNGSRIILGHYQTEGDIDTYLGLEYDVALVEEATQLTSQKVLDIATCVRTSKTDWRPRIYFTTNPGGVGHAWFKEQFIEPMLRGEQTRTRFVQATVRDNNFVNPEYLHALEELTGWQREAWLEGSWDIAAGQFFTTWRRSVHVIEPFPIPQNWKVWASLDYGFTHFTVCYLIAQDGDGNLYAVDEHAERNWLPQRHATAITQMLARHGLEPVHLDCFVAGADVFQKRMIGASVGETYAALGLPMTPANMDRINGAGEILARLGDTDAERPVKPRLFVMDRCRRLIDCIPALEHDPHRAEDVLKVDCDERGLGGDDAYDAFRYGVMVAWQPPRNLVHRSRPIYRVTA